MVGAPPVQGPAANLGRMKARNYIMAMNGVNTEGRTAFDIIDQISNDLNYLFVTMKVRTTASGTNGNAPSSSADDVVCNVTARR